MLSVTYVEGIFIEFEVMAVTPQTPKCHHNLAVTPQTPTCHHNLGYVSVVVTFGSLWCHSHGRKRGIKFYSIMVPQN